MKIVIIGGTGYIGSRLFNFLKENHSVETVDLEWFGNFVNPNNIKEDFRKLETDFWQKFDVIILYAGHSSVPMCIGKMRDSFLNNVESFVDLLDKIKDKKFIYASSSSVYGNTSGKCATEEWNQFNPCNFYDLSKKIIDLYAETNGKNWFGLRMGTVAGPSINLRIDIMINKMYHSAKTTGKITVFNPEINRPILGISDLCRAISSIIDQDATPGAYNLASFNANVNEISQAVAEAIGNIEIINTGSSPTYDFSIDTTKFKKTFNFEFKDTVKNLIQELNETYENCNKGIRT